MYHTICIHSDCIAIWDWPSRQMSTKRIILTTVSGLTNQPSTRSGDTPSARLSPPSKTPAWPAPRTKTRRGRTARLQHQTQTRASPAATKAGPTCPALCSFRKKPYPPHGRSVEIPRGRGPYKPIF